MADSSVDGAVLAHATGSQAVQRLRFYVLCHLVRAPSL
jgi:hypothetical protein